MMASVNLNLDDHDLSMQSLSLASACLLQQSYGNLLLAQQPYNLNGMDAGLSTKIAAYQRQMYSQANYYNHDTLPKIIVMLTFGSNFSALVGAFNAIIKSNDANQVINDISQLNQQLESLSDQAESYSIIAQATVNQINLAWGKLEPLMKNYQLILHEAEQSLSSEAKQLADNIRLLSATIAQNIQDIVTQGNKAGEGIRLIGKGIITSFTVDETDDKKDKQPEKQKESKDDTGSDQEDTANDEAGSKPETEEGTKADNPQNKVNDVPAAQSQPSGFAFTPAQQEKTDRSVEYFVSGITAVSSGVAGASQAEKDLLANTKKIAQSYQQLAKINAVITVAKSVNAQNELFTDNFKQLSGLARAIPDSWHAISGAFENVTDVTSNFKNENDVTQFERALALNTLKWTLLAQQIDSIKSVYAGNGSLPDA